MNDFNTFDVSEVISGKEAWVAKSEGQLVEWCLQGLNWAELTDEKFMGWDTSRFLGMNSRYKFRLKPRNITLNGVEVPAPFEPREGEMFFYLYSYSSNGFDCQYKTVGNSNYAQFGAWRTETEIQQVVAAMRKLREGV